MKAATKTLPVKNVAPSRRVDVAAPDRFSTPAIAFLVLVAATLVIADLVILPSRFKDYETYLLYLDSIQYFRQADWFVFEGLAKAYLLFLRALTGTTEGGITIAHYLLLIIFFAGFLAIFRLSEWEAIAIAAALFAPQLGLVTIRATPAYVVCTLAAMRVIRKQPYGVLLCIAATTLHVSAFLALIPILATRIIAATPFGRYNVHLTVVIAAGVAIGLVALFFAQQVFDLLLDIFRQIPYLEKYSAYAVGLADPSLATDQTVSEPTSANHYIFLGGASALFVALISFERERTLLKLFGVISFVLYLAIFFGFSPVPAFRFAPFFMLPVLALARFDNPRWKLIRSLVAFPVLLGCAAAFALQLGLVFS